MIKFILTGTNKVTQKQKLIGRIKLSRLFDITEYEFHKLIEKIEKELLFKKLVYPSDTKDKIISYKKFYKTDLSNKLFEIKEYISIDTTSEFNIESLLQEKNNLIPFIRNLGIEKFKKYFLYNEEGLNIQQISTKCAIPQKITEKIMDVINNFSIYQEFSQSNIQSQTPTIHYNKIASIELDKDNEYSINFFSPVFARGKYIIDYSKLEKLMHQKKFSKKELKKIKQLTKILELINLKKNTVYNILKKITTVQEKYLHTKNLFDLNILSQATIANELKICPSMVTRAIKYRTIIVPEDHEIPIRKFFISRKTKTKMILEQLLKSGFYNDITDEKIRQILKVKHNINLSRRTINQYRNELTSPNNKTELMKYSYK